MTIHWCGTGLSAIPGLRRLIGAGHDVQVWNRSPGKAEAAVGDLTDRIRVFDADALAAILAPGDVVVSMLPADWHVPLARAAIAAGANFVSSSYTAPEMRALAGPARAEGVALVNEIGLDPGIDHLMAHGLLAEYRGSDAFDPANQLHFLSYCGGIPRISNPFRYKFSWSPLGVLKALRTPSRSLSDGRILEAARPWEALSTFEAPLPRRERFEVYPNRDSLPFVAQYGIDPSWDLRDFVRGTLRLDGWAKAWTHVFGKIEALDGPEGDAGLSDMSDRLWAENAYGPDEADRVVLVVDLRAARDGADVWHRTFVLDASGDARGSAMARLVSVPVALAVEAVIGGDIAPGLHAATNDPPLVARFLSEIAALAQYLQVVDRLA
ncbi:saccharopine dehydrogenase C-terminal domain-containing protein [Palleronia rufa]|uniref:saccharopine dehydrogenase C-terminal domain-containing protein n=1 Tax=Palleronia rufa TaxID=1530186 RepID=UPI00056CCB99|nr:saccharopine dehydrogenase C-terminal domain-containing protein [Palleronia rufa]